MKTVLVTGASGFVGSHAAEALAAGGWRVRGLMRSTSSRRWLEPLAASGALEYALGDVGDAAALARAATGCDAIVHAAGITNASRLALYHEVNVAGTRRVLAAARDAGVPRFLYVSSLAAAGPSPEGVIQDETRPPVPVSAYGHSKLEGERVVLTERGAVEAVIVRPPAVYGPRDTDVLTLVRAVKQGWFPRVGRARREVSVVHALDLAHGMRQALEAGANGAIYYLTDGAVHEVMAVAAVIGEALGVRPRALPVPRFGLWLAALAGEVANRLGAREAVLNFDRYRQFVRTGWTASDALARRELGYASRYDLERGMRETVEWYRSTGWI
jgi:nucleoside-diphosphate-sugar epimerase